MSDYELSIVVLTYNRRFFLEECLESLFAQSIPKDRFEIVVVDDGSTDGTLEFMGGLIKTKPNLNYVRQVHGGISKGRNSGIKNSKAGIIAFVADDYILPKTYVKTILDFFKENPEAQCISFKMGISKNSNFITRCVHNYYTVSIKNVLASAHAWKKTRLDKFLYYFKRIKYDEKLKAYYNISASRAAAFKKDVFEKVGLFNESLPSGEDSDMGIRMTKNNIGIYHYPLLIIEHTSSENLFGVIKKWFKYGWHFYDFKIRYANNSMRLPDSFKNVLYYLANIILNPIWRSIQADSAIDGILFFPVMFLMNLSYTIGIFCRAAVLALGKDKKIEGVKN